MMTLSYAKWSYFQIIAWHMSDQGSELEGYEYIFRLAII